MRAIASYLRSNPVIETVIILESAGFMKAITARIARLVYLHRFFRKTYVSEVVKVHYTTGSRFGRKIQNTLVRRRRRCTGRRNIVSLFYSFVEDVPNSYLVSYRWERVNVYGNLWDRLSRALNQLVYFFLCVTGWRSLDYFRICFTFID